MDQGQQLHLVDDIDELRHSQHDVLSRAQVLEHFEARGVRSMVRTGRWQSPHSRVVVLHNGPLTTEQRHWVAVLAAPDGSALGGATAAKLDRFDLPVADDGRIEVVVPQGARRLGLPWVRTRWSTALDGLDVHPVAAPRRTRLPRSVLDVASDQAEPRLARTVVFAAVQQRLVTASALDAALDRRGPCRHHGQIVETILDLGGDIHSVPERDFDRIVTSRGLPRPTRQAVLRRPGGRHYLDAVWKEYRLAVEVDGSQHLDASQWDLDLRKAADVVADGLRLLRFTTFAVRHQKRDVGDVMVRALVSGGWIPGS
jgi:hypothetical protein